MIAEKSVIVFLVKTLSAMFLSWWQQNCTKHMFHCLSFFFWPFHFVFMSPFRSQLGNIKAMNCIIPTSCWMEAIAFFTDLPHSGNTCDFCQSPVFFSEMVFRYFIFVRAGWEPIFGWLRAKCCLIENGLFGGKTFSHLVYLCFIHLDFWLNHFFFDHNPFFLIIQTYESAMPQGHIYF